MAAVVVSAMVWIGTHDIDMDFGCRSKAKWREWPREKINYASVIIGGTRQNIEPGQCLNLAGYHLVETETDSIYYLWHIQSGEYQ